MTDYLSKYGGMRTTKRYFDASEAFPQPVDDIELQECIIAALPEDYSQPGVQAARFIASGLCRAFEDRVVNLDALHVQDVRCLLHYLLWSRDPVRALHAILTLQGHLPYWLHQRDTHCPHLYKFDSF